jgi:hypothetical protein
MQRQTDSTTIQWSGVVSIKKKLVKSELGTLPYLSSYSVWPSSKVTSVMLLYLCWFLVPKPKKTRSLKNYNDVQICGPVMPRVDPLVTKFIRLALESTAPDFTDQ